MQPQDHAVQNSTKGFGGLITGEPEDQASTVRIPLCSYRFRRRPTLTQRTDAQEELPQLVPTDRLSSLPPEILHLIFSYVYEGRHNGAASWKTSAISKFLLPFMKIYLNRSIHIESWKAFNCLGRRHRQSSEAHLIQDLIIKFPDKYKFEPAPSLKSVQSAFAALYNLNSLELSDQAGAQLASYILSDASIIHKSTKLKKLSLQWIFQDSSTLRDWHSWLALHTPALEELEIAACLSVAASLDGSTLPVFPSNVSVTTLSAFLIHWPADKVAKIANFLASFTLLSDLQITCKGRCDFIGNLENISSNLTYLSVLHLNNEPADSENLVTALQWLPNLALFTLVLENSNLVSAAFFSGLAKASKITCLLLNCYTLAGLQLLLSEMKGLEALYLRSGHHWDSHLTFQDTLELRRLSQSSKVRVEGRLFDAIEAQERQDAEVAKAQKDKFGWERGREFRLARQSRLGIE